MTKLLAFALAFATVPSALAASPWDGTWKLDRSKSHLTGDSFTYSKAANGMWHLSGGDISVDFTPDGKPYAPFDPDHTFMVTLVDDHHLVTVNQLKGKTMSTSTSTLSADGNTLTDETVGTHMDGSSYTSSSTSKRSGAGTGFFGKWVSTKTSDSSPGLFTISMSADGAMTTYNPTSKSTEVSKLDGSPSVLSGPDTPPADEFVMIMKKVSATRLDYSGTLKGKKIFEGYQTISADGKTLTDISWAPSKIDEKTTAVYLKQE